LGKYLAIVFSDLERHSQAWGRIPRNRMVAIIAEYRYLAESLASQYGCLYREWAGDGHMFLFKSADAAVQFGLRLLEAWKDTSQSRPAAGRYPHMPLRLGCHFGECAQLDGGQGWIGRGNSVAKRVESEAQPDSLFVTENVLDLIDLPLYEFQEAGTRALKGDAVASRTLYQVRSFDRSAFEAKPTAELTAQEWLLKGVALIGTDRENSDEEAECYRQALRLRPDFAEAHNNLAILLRRRGDPTEAAMHYQEALRLRPDYPEAHYNYAALLAARGSVAGADQHYQTALDLRPDYVDAHHGMANLLKDRGDFAEAAGHYQEALRLRSDSPEVHNNYAILLEAMNEPGRAAEHYREALRLRPDYPEAHYNYALLLEGANEVRAAEEHYREALRLRPVYPEAHNNLAILLNMRGDLAEAETHYLEALRLRPDDPEVHYNYALLLKAKGDQSGTERHLQIAYDLAPENPTFKSAVEPPV